MDMTRAESPSPTERRRQRSDIPYQAAELYLGRLRDRRALRAAAIADENELLALWGALDAGERGRFANEMDEVCGKDCCISGKFAIDAGTWSFSGIASSALYRSSVEGDLTRIFATHGARRGA